MTPPPRNSSPFVATTPCPWAAHPRAVALGGVEGVGAVAAPQLHLCATVGGDAEHRLPADGDRHGAARAVGGGARRGEAPSAAVADGEAAVPGVGRHAEGEALGLLPGPYEVDHAVEAGLGQLERLLEALVEPGLALPREHRAHEDGYQTADDHDGQHRHRQAAALGTPRSHGPRGADGAVGITDVDMEAVDRRHPQRVGGPDAAGDALERELGVVEGGDLSRLATLSAEGMDDGSGYDRHHDRRHRHRGQQLHEGDAVFAVEPPSTGHAATTSRLTVAEAVAPSAVRMALKRNARALPARNLDDFWRTVSPLAAHSGHGAEGTSRKVPS